MVIKKRINENVKKNDKIKKILSSKITFFQGDFNLTQEKNLRAGFKITAGSESRKQNEVKKTTFHNKTGSNRNGNKTNQTLPKLFNTSGSKERI